MNRHTRLFWATLVILWVAWACQSADDAPPEAPAGKQRTVVSAQDIPGVIQQLQTKLGLPGGVDQFSTAGGADGDGPQLTIDWDRILQLVEEDGMETYTLAIEDNDGDPFTFYNLIMQLNADKQAYQPFLLKYELSEEFIPEYLATGSLANFTRKVSKTVLSPISRSNRQNTAALDPAITLNGTTCPGGGVTYTGGVGTIGGGGWSTDPINIEDPDPVTTVTCTTYMNYTVWRNADGSINNIQYHGIEVDCEETPGGGSTSSDNDGACAPLSGEIPILTPTWPSDLIILQDNGEEITDISEYLKCFQPSQPVELTLYVDQPKPGKRDTWSGWATNPDVGHTFISITQGGYTRVLGFYPGDGVNPYLDPTANSVLVNDSNHEYDVSITTNLNGTQFDQLLTIINSYENTYDLNNYNCTDFAIHCYNVSGASLPDTSGSWPGGGGTNPGDLGEDLRGFTKGGHITNGTTRSAKGNLGNCN